VIDPFDLELLESMATNTTSEELHNEIIAMTCKKHGIDIIYSNDEDFDQNYGLTLRKF
jgi:predicted nucleic acid-binding protein